MSNTDNILTGSNLNKLWRTCARHALYREDGKWYHKLKAFPGVLFDANGYIIFNTKKEYLESPFLQIKKDLHVPKGISSIPNYIRVTEDNHLQNFSRRLDIKKKENISLVNLEKAIKKPLFDTARETKRRLYNSYRIIRDTRISEWVKYIYDFKCQICKASIDLGDGQYYAEAHHIQPLGKDHRGPDVIENIICVCPNHHVQLDFGAIKLDKSILNIFSGHEINDRYIQYYNSFVYKF
jgi:5-methylcytosine-specific restriction protein A